MYNIIVGSFLLSVLHAAIPNHWLPIIAIGRKEQWSLPEVFNITIIAALAHGFSTILIGLVLSMLGKTMADTLSHFTHLVAPVIFILLGLYFIYRHHHHKHFHLSDVSSRNQSKRQIITALVIAMFFSPCMEIEAYFLLAGTQSGWLVAGIAIMYVIITTTGMVLLVSLAYKGLVKLNWHSLEHNAGIITGITLVITGIVSFFIF